MCRRGLKVNAGKTKVMVMNGEEGLEYEAHVDGIQIKYLGFLDKSGRDWAECNRKVATGRREAGAIRSLVNGRDLQLQYARVLHETLLVYVLMYESETMIWKEKERSRIRNVQIDNLRGLLGIKMMDRVLYAWIRELYRVNKEVDERIDESVLWWLGSVEKIDRYDCELSLCRKVY